MIGSLSGSACSGAAEKQGIVAYGVEDDAELASDFVGFAIHFVVAARASCIYIILSKTATLGAWTE